MALLVSLALLAERAAGRSLPIRFFVLWLLRRAEAVATQFVFEATGLPQPANTHIALVESSAADALRLAARLRSLAAALGALLAVVLRFGRRPHLGGVAFGFVTPVVGCRSSCWTRVLNDTS